MSSRHIIPANEVASANEDSLDRLRAAIAKAAASGSGTPKHPAGEGGARKQAPARLQGSRTVASIAERLTHVGAWSVELPALSLTVSNEVLAIHGIPPGGTLTVEESIGQYAPEYRETITRAFGACVNSGTPFDLEVQLITPGGQRVWVRSVGEAVRDAAGVIQRVQGAIQEISEHTQATAETRQQLAERLTTTIESITDAFFTLDREWRFTFVNREAARLLQRSRAELIGADWRKEFSAAVDAAFGIEYRRAIAENLTVQFEEFYPPLNTWFSVRAYPSSEGLAVYFLDITERKRMEKMLRESEAEFRTLAEGMPQIVWITNAAGENVYFNQQWMDYTGLSLEESLGAGWNKPFHPEDQQRAWRAWQRATAGIEAYSVECRLRRADGIYRWWLIRGVPLRDANGTPIRWLGTCTDIDDLKVAEAEVVRAMEKLNESDEKFHQLADNVTDVFWVASPDLRTVHYVSPAYEQVWGRSVESQYAHPSQWSDTIVPADRERVITAFAGLAAKKAVVNLDCQIQRPDASVRWIHMRVFRVEDTTGQLIRLTGIASDITERKHSEEATERALQRLNEAQRIGLIGDWEYDLTRGITWSPEVFRIFGRDPGLGAPSSLGDAEALYDSASKALMAEKVALAIESGEPQQYQLLALRPDGTKVHVQLIASPHMDATGEVVSLHGTVQDISERKRDEQAIKDRASQQELIVALGQSALANADLDHLFSEAGLAIAQGLSVGFSKVMEFATDDQSFIVKAGAGWEPSWLGRRISTADGGIRLGEILAGKPAIIDDFRAEQPISTSAILRAHGISSGVDVPIVCSDGPWGVLGGYSRDFRQFGVEHLDFLRSIANILATGIDRRRREDQLVHLAHYDPLTNLPNNLLFNDRLAAAIVQARRSGTRTAVLCLDLDRFKNVNDAFGHGQGDRLLQEVARRLASLTRASDTLSRQGGDEFLVLMPGMEIGEDPARVAEQMIRSMDSYVNVGFDEAVLVTGSIGIACFPDNGKDAETLLSNADAAMYAAKEAGRNCYRFYSEEMNARAHERLLLEADLGKAIARGELFLQFQPQVVMGSGAVTGMEALVRWRHPVLGLVPPGRFIPLAEESGLIVSIGNWVLETACRQQAQWVRDGLAHGRMAVNVSAVQFRQPSFLGTVVQTLERTGLDRRYLELELTESVILRGIDGVREKLTALNKLGVTFAIDDFGTGQSNLSYLRQFPIHHLKIDQSFVKGIPADKENGAITQAIISMGHSLGLTVIAEGVETRSQAEYLQSMWCDEAQGFYYSRPLFPADCAAFLRCEAPRLNPVASEGS